MSAAAVLMLIDAAYIIGQELFVAGGSDLVIGVLETPPHDRLASYSGFHHSMAPAAVTTQR